SKRKSPLTRWSSMLRMMMQPRFTNDTDSYVCRAPAVGCSCRSLKSQRYFLDLDAETCERARVERYLRLKPTNRIRKLDCFCPFLKPNAHVQGFALRFLRRPQGFAVRRLVFENGPPFSRNGR